MYPTNTRDSKLNKENRKKNKGKEKAKLHKEKPRTEYIKSQEMVYQTGAKSIMKARKKRYRKKRYGKNSKAMVKIAKSVYMQQTKKLAELKYWDDSILATGVDYFATNTMLPMLRLTGASPFSTGTGPTNYIGEYVTPTSIQIRYSIYNAGASTSLHTVRIIVFQWHDDFFGPSISNILTYGSGTAAATISPYSMAYSEKYSIVYDELIDLSGQLSGNSDSTAAGEIFIKPLSIKAPNLKRQCKIPNGASTVQDGYYCMVVSNISGALSPLIDIAWRVRFYDY